LGETYRKETKEACRAQCNDNGAVGVQSTHLA